MSHRERDTEVLPSVPRPNSGISPVKQPETQYGLSAKVRNTQNIWHGPREIGGDSGEREGGKGSERQKVCVCVCINVVQSMASDAAPLQEESLIEGTRGERRTRGPGCRSLLDQPGTLHSCASTPRQAADLDVPVARMERRVEPKTSVGSRGKENEVLHAIDGRVEVVARVIVHGCRDTIACQPHVRLTHRSESASHACQPHGQEAADTLLIALTTPRTSTTTSLAGPEHVILSSRTGPSTRAHTLAHLHGGIGGEGCQRSDMVTDGWSDDGFQRTARVQTALALAFGYVQGTGRVSQMDENAPIPRNCRPTKRLKMTGDLRQQSTSINQQTAYLPSQFTRSSRGLEVQVCTHSLARAHCLALTPTLAHGLTLVQDSPFSFSQTHPPTYTHDCYDTLTGWRLQSSEEVGRRYDALGIRLYSVRVHSMYV